MDLTQYDNEEINSRIAAARKLNRISHKNKAVMHRKTKSICDDYAGQIFSLHLAGASLTQIQTDLRVNGKPSLEIHPTSIHRFIVKNVEVLVSFANPVSPTTATKPESNET